MKISQEWKVLKPQNSCSRLGSVYIYTNQLVSFCNDLRKKIINHKNDAKIDPKMISIKKKTRSDVGEHNILPKISQTFRFWLPFWSHLLETLQLWRVFFANHCSDSLRELPLDRFWPPLWHPWFDVLDMLAGFRNKTSPKSKQIQSNKLHQSRLQKNKQGFKKQITDNQ